MSALVCLFLCFQSYPEKLEVYIWTFYKISYILQELYVAVMWIISRLIIYIDQLNTATVNKLLNTKSLLTTPSNVLPLQKETAIQMLTTRWRVVRSNLLSFLKFLNLILPIQVTLISSKSASIIHIPCRK